MNKDSANANSEHDANLQYLKMLILYVFYPIMSLMPTFDDPIQPWYITNKQNWL